MDKLGVVDQFPGPHAHRIYRILISFCG
ncbi:unnamed protein product [Larinioides sclopetarius]|uniref:Uncharacterized protein n=1 Tax=Larinioides sclopetarius TaxID=280406 RepID=A0AAV1ZFS2_9ARAC